MPPLKSFTLCLLATALAAHAQTITDFGSSASSIGSLGWTYNPSTSQVMGFEQPGDVIYGTPLVMDLSSSSAIRLTANATTAPAGFFTVTLESTGGNLVISQFSWSDFSGGDTVTSAWSTNPLFDPSSVIGWTIDSGGSNQAIDVTFSQMAAVPEPSSIGFLVAGAVGLLTLKRLRRTARSS